VRGASLCVSARGVGRGVYSLKVTREVLPLMVSSLGREPLTLTTPEAVMFMALEAAATWIEAADDWLTTEAEVERSEWAAMVAVPSAVRLRAEVEPLIERSPEPEACAERVVELGNF